MTNIYFSYAHADAAIAQQLASLIAKAGYHVFIDSTVLSPGSDWRKALLSALKDADAVVVLVSENSVKSDYVIGEIGTALAFAGESGEKLIIPIFYQDVEIPRVIADIQGVRLKDSGKESLFEISKLIDLSISKFIGKREAKRTNQTQVQAEIESKAASYIAEAKIELRKREEYNKVIGIISYILGFIALMAGACFGFYGLKSLSEITSDSSWIYVLGFLKSSIVVGLLVASAKYAFDLGGSFTHESLKNSDRIHAISYGEFYLKAFGDKASSTEELTNLFQHWNIDNTSSAFLKLDSDKFDPKIVDKMLDLVKTSLDKVKVDK